MAVHPSQVSVVVVMVGNTDYWQYSRPFIEQYCQRNGYEFIVHTRNETPEPWHPAWNKLIATASASRPHVLLWDADLVPMPLCPPIHFWLDADKIGMVRIEPSKGGRDKLRRRYGRAAYQQMFFNTGLISVPLALRGFLADLHRTENFENSIFWEQGTINHAVYQRQMPVDSLDPRWNVWVSTRLREEQIDSAFCLHFARGSSRRMRNIGKLCQLLRRRGQLPWNVKRRHSRK